MYQECRHIMPNGWKCRGNALRGQHYCYFHARLHRRDSARKKAVGKTRPAEQALEFPVLEDRCAIQLALDEVLNALGSSQIDSRRASLLLYGLQIASQNVDRDVWILPAEMAESVTHSRDGQELAPPTLVCEPGDCHQCERFKSCNEPQARQTRARLENTAPKALASQGNTR